MTLANVKDAQEIIYNYLEMRHILNYEHLALEFDLYNSQS